MLHYEFTCKTGGERTDKFLALQDTGITRSAAAALIEQGCCLVNGKIAAKNQKLKTGDTVTLDVPEAQPADILPENIPLDIVYEDGDLLVVNKPKGMAVHSCAGSLQRNACKCAYVPLRRQPVGDKRGNSPGYSTQDRQGYKRPSYRSKERYRTQYTCRTDKGTQLYKGIYGGDVQGVIKEDRDGRCADRQTQDRPQEDVRYDREFKRGGNPLFCRADIQEQYACKASS